MLVWSVLAFALVGLSTLSPAAHGVAPPLAAFSITPTVPLPLAVFSATPTVSLPPAIFSVTLTVSPPLAVYSVIPTVPPTPSPTLQPAAAETTVPLPLPTLTQAPAHTLAPTRLVRSDSLIGDDTVVIALLGRDEGSSPAIWRTDTIMLVFVQEEAERVSILSLPRDLWVFIPGYGYDRINTVDSLGERRRYPGGGPALLDETLRYNFKVHIDHYVRVDYGGFVRIIDAIGGIMVNVENPITDAFPDPFSPTGWTQISLPAGLCHMGGRTALSYSRSRGTADDFDRSRRQQQVMMAFWKKAMTPETLLQAPKLWAEFSDSFETDLAMAQVIRLAYLAYRIDPENVRAKRLEFALARPWRTPGGAEVLLPRTKAIQELILDMLSLRE